MPGPSAPAKQTPYQAGLESSNIAQSYENTLPGYLNIYQNPLFNPSSPQAQGYIGNYANTFYNQYEAPQVAQIGANNFNTGMINSSSGGAEQGEAAAEGGAISGLAGTQAYEQLLGGLNNTSSNYFQGPGAAGLSALGASNQYQQAGYGTASQNYRAQLGAATSLGTAGK